MKRLLLSVAQCCPILSLVMPCAVVALRFCAAVLLHPGVVEWHGLVAIPCSLVNGVCTSMLAYHSTHCGTWYLQAVYDAKSEEIGPGIYRFKAEIGA